MMKRSIVVAILLSGAAWSADKPKRCTDACMKQVDGTLVCWYDEKKQCGRREVECVDSDRIECKPVVVNLGSWDPVPPAEKQSNIQ